jgi:predicted NAD-dependent protein-ADP-ribosyltransferase YbiA (DUF1768 family)
MLKNLGNNKVEISKGSTTVFYSYNTPVAANINGKYYRTAEHYSVTTSKHINQWLDGVMAEEKPQKFFNNL